jgi:hypothetical protein
VIFRNIKALRDTNIADVGLLLQINIMKFCFALL